MRWWQGEPWKFSEYRRSLTNIRCQSKIDLEAQVLRRGQDVAGAMQTVLLKGHQTGLQQGHRYLKGRRSVSFGDKQ